MARVSVTVLASDNEMLDLDSMRYGKVPRLAMKQDEYIGVEIRGLYLIGYFWEKIK